MSGIALIWAANVKGLKPAAKIVLIQLADFHNKETGQCNPSAQRLADECEMGRATLFRHMSTLEEKGLVTRHARGDGDGGRGANHYELHLDVSLGPSARNKAKSDSQNGVSSRNETGGRVSKTRRKSLNCATGVVSKRDTNLTIEPEKEPVCSADAALHTHPAFDDFWKAFPRHKDRERTAKAFAQAIADGTAPNVIIAGAKAYAVENDGNRKQYIAFSENWLNEQRWQNHEVPTVSTAVDAETIAQKIATQIIERKSWVANTVTATKARELVSAGLVSIDECKAAGVAI
ncbi:hypothetical protein DSM110093_01981 [Sulfitobacter sp. DSM 110093]|uniref:helix-turn-helix domain-containing protein n=1 Tax=Sulfitobacter sp. DSM 110093 TaxID=2883127 RepID=UPI001FAE4668|nr:helix-turn-helix domain-containing protein [Sulfitobacter sp. DSM 110093]UOA32196.1 hypothetical protein DSM110093_01981 [Sulfitobacter sp. DSM 110093]